MTNEELANKVDNWRKNLRDIESRLNIIRHEILDTMDAKELEGENLRIAYLLDDEITKALELLSESVRTVGILFINLKYKW